jgi:ribonuclease HI
MEAVNCNARFVICDYLPYKKQCMQTIRVYTDGGARGNPGPAACAAVLKRLDDGEEKETLAEVSLFLGTTTNNQAEYRGVIEGLKKAKELGAQIVEVVMDSELAVKQLNREYKVKDPGIAARFLDVWNLAQAFRRVTFRHVRREQNQEADTLVNACLDAHLSS